MFATAMQFRDESSAIAPGYQPVGISASSDAFCWANCTSATLFCAPLQTSSMLFASNIRAVGEQPNASSFCQRVEKVSTTLSLVVSKKLTVSLLEFATATYRSSHVAAIAEGCRPTSCSFSSLPLSRSMIETDPSIAMESHGVDFHMRSFARRLALSDRPLPAGDHPSCSRRPLRCGWRDAERRIADVKHPQRFSGVGIHLQQAIGHVQP